MTRDWRAEAPSTDVKPLRSKPLCSQVFPILESQGSLFARLAETQIPIEETQPAGTWNQAPGSQGRVSFPGDWQASTVLLIQES